MAKVDVIMPQMGESIAEGTLSKWLKKLGDEVKRDEPIFEISTDKVDAEIPAPAAGVLAEIMVQEGQTVPVQTIVALIETDKGAAVAVGPGDRGTGGQKTARPQPAVAAVAPSADSSVPRSPGPSVPLSPGPAVPRSPLPGGAETGDERLRRLSTPLVRKIAAEHRVDIATLRGTGHAGRVTKRDLIGYIETGAAVTAPTAPAAPTVPTVPLPTAVTGTSPWEATPWPGDRVEPMTRIRQLTAEHMIFSRRTSAHVTSFYEVDMHRVAKLREQHKAAYAGRGAKLTYLGFIVKAVADQLRRHPVLNAAVQGTSVIYRGQINIGIAVALDWGLIVPVLRHADELNVLGVAKTMADLADRARTKKLKPEEVQHGTFTITNPGVFGSYVGAPIINQPQVAILGVGAIEKRPKVITTEDGTDTIVPRMMTMLSISYDHRIVDGADADRFMADLKKELEDFSEGAL